MIVTLKIFNYHFFISAKIIKNIKIENNYFFETIAGLCFCKN